MKQLSPMGRSALVAMVVASIATASADANEKKLTFDMVRGAKLVASKCLPNATARVSIKPGGPVEVMDVSVAGLPPNTDFDFFVIQKPGAPFGMAWYQGDIQTDKHGRGHAQFAGRFSIETFTFAQGSAPAPFVFNNDAVSNPPFNPVQMYHLGLWFDSPDDARNAN